MHFTLLKKSSYSINLLLSFLSRILMSLNGCYYFFEFKTNIFKTWMTISSETDVSIKASSSDVDMTDRNRLIDCMIDAYIYWVFINHPYPYDFIGERWIWWLHVDWSSWMMTWKNLWWYSCLFHFLYLNFILMFWILFCTHLLWFWFSKVFLFIVWRAFLLFDLFEYIWVFFILH